MAKISRSYKKTKAKRNLEKFIIVVEGDMEKNYFSIFENINNKIIVLHVKRKGSKANVKHLIERLNQYNYREGIEEEDHVWFVLDVDRWMTEDIEELEMECQSYEKWGIALSNFGFEVWLYYHINEDIPVGLTTNGKLSKIVNMTINNGFSLKDFASKIENAIINSFAADPYNADLCPTNGVSKIYKLGEKLVKFLGSEGMVILKEVK